MLLTTACNDYLNVENKGKVDSKNFSQNINNLELVLAGVYATAASNRFQKCLYKFGEATADHMYLISTDVTSEDQQFCTFTYTPRNYLLSDMWKSCYEGINRANRTLENLEIAFWPWYEFAWANAQDTTLDSDIYVMHGDRFQWIAGEAKFWRAYFYFNLVRTFGEVPIQNEMQYINKDGNNFFTPRMSVDTVYDYIEKDLREAMLSCRQSIDITKQGDVIDAGRITRGAAAALYVKIKAYRASKNKSNASEYWNDVIKFGSWITGDKAKYQVDPTITIKNSEVLDWNDYPEGTTWSDIQDMLYLRKSTTGNAKNEPDDILGAPANYGLIDYYDMLFRVEGEFCKESIFEINHNYSGNGLENNLNTGSSVWDQICNQEASGTEDATTGTSKYMKPSGLLAETLRATDPRYIFCNPSTGDVIIPNKLRFGFQSTGVPYGHSGKYFVWPEFWPSNGEKSDNPRNVMILRYAEILLFMAEAQNELGQTEEALYKVNLLRERARHTFGEIGSTFNPQKVYPDAATLYPRRVYYLESNPVEDLPALHDASVIDQTTARQLIWDERAVELCHEWDRFYDLVRTGQAYQAIYIDYWTGQSSDINNQDRRKYFVKDKHEIFAIPQEEILKSNGKWKQNPGY